jgi:hypothetical protein
MTPTPHGLDSLLEPTTTAQHSHCYCRCSYCFCYSQPGSLYYWLHCWQHCRCHGSLQHIAGFPAVPAVPAVSSEQVVVVMSAVHRDEGSPAVSRAMVALLQHTLCATQHRTAHSTQLRECIGWGARIPLQHKDLIASHLLQGGCMPAACLSWKMAAAPTTQSNLPIPKSTAAYSTQATGDPVSIQTQSRTLPAPVSVHLHPWNPAAYG